MPVGSSNHAPRRGRTSIEPPLDDNAPCLDQPTPSYPWHKTHTYVPRIDPDYSLRSRAWCFTVRSGELDHVWQQQLRRRVAEGNILGYEYAFELDNAGGGDGAGEGLPAPYPHYHGTVLLRDRQRGLSYFRAMFGRGVHIRQLGRSADEKFGWRSFCRKTMPNALAELDSEEVAQYYRRRQAAGHFRLSPHARPAWKEGPRWLTAMKDLGQTALHQSPRLSQSHPHTEDNDYVFD